MKVFAISPCVSYSGGACIVVAESEQAAWDIALRELSEFNYYDRDDFGISELPLQGENPGVVFNHIYIE